MVMFGHINNLSMAAGDNKGEERERRGIGIRCVTGMEPVGIDVGLEVVDRIERFVPEDGEHTGGKGAN